MYHQIVNTDASMHMQYFTDVAAGGGVSSTCFKYSWFSFLQPEGQAPPMGHKKHFCEVMR